MKKSDQKALAEAVKAVAGANAEIRLRCLYEVSCTTAGRTHTTQGETLEDAYRALIKRIVLADVPMPRGGQ
jgi:hypothetical protein